MPDSSGRSVTGTTDRSRVVSRTMRGTAHERRDDAHEVVDEQVVAHGIIDPPPWSIAPTTP
jgi:hypothetical protein